MHITLNIIGKCYLIIIYNNCYLLGTQTQTSTATSRKIIAYKTKVVKLQQRLKLKRFGLAMLEKDHNQLLFYTGIDLARFKFLFKALKGMPLKTSQISGEDHLLVLMRLRKGFQIKDLAFRFMIREATASLIFRTWLTLMSQQLVPLIKWPDRHALRENLPTCFRKHRKCVAIIDCTEVFIERPLNLQARAQTWSSYKNHNTVKYFISITPVGTVSFLSHGWGGRVSDKVITNKCGFLDMIEFGDLVLADRGFTMAEELACKGAILEIPAFTKGKKQLSQYEVDKSSRLANVRIHVERVIGRTRKFELINTTIPITQVDLLDDIMVVICAIVNICKSVVQ